MDEESLVVDQLRESYRAALSCGTVYYATLYKVVLTFNSADAHVEP